MLLRRCARAIARLPRLWLAALRSVIPFAAWAAACPSAAAEEPRREPGDGELPSEPPPGTPLPRHRFGPEQTSPHYLRAALEELGVLAIGTAQYWSARHANRRDWDYPRWSDRFTFDSIRFDNNTHATNNLLHPFGGAAYYGVARVNGVGVGLSIVYAQLSSAAWEWGLEWREKVSINDMIVTTAAGTAAGEFLVHLATYLNSAPGPTTFAQDVAAATLGAPVLLHRSLDGETAASTPAPDNLGFSSAYHHRFTLDLENVWLDDAAELSQVNRGLSLGAELVAMPGFMQPEAFSVWFAQGNFTSAFIDAAWGESGLAEARVAFDAVLAGHYSQHLGAGTTGLLFGVGSGLEFVDRDTLERPDQFGLAHLTGPVAGIFHRRAGFELQAIGRLQGDFAAIRSLSWPRVRQEFPDDVFKSSLQAGSYQYHLGVSTRLSLAVRLGAAQLSFEHRFGTYRSIEGLDRFQESVTRDPDGSETLHEYGVGLALEPPSSPVRVHAGLERLSHEGQLAGTPSGRLERRLYVGIGVLF